MLSNLFNQDSSSFIYTILHLTNIKHIITSHAQVYLRRHIHDKCFKYPLLTDSFSKRASNPNFFPESMIQYPLLLKNVLQSPTSYQKTMLQPPTSYVNHASNSTSFEFYLFSKNQKSCLNPTFLLKTMLQPPTSYVNHASNSTSFEFYLFFSKNQKSCLNPTFLLKTMLQPPTSYVNHASNSTSLLKTVF